MDRIWSSLGRVELTIAWRKQSTDIPNNRYKNQVSHAPPIA